MDKKTEIYRRGKELFNEKGFKDTSIADITTLAGIAAGTFYLYYPSKEDLFMEIYLAENVELKKRALESINMEGEPMNIVREITRLNLIGIKSNPILREWYNREVFSKIEQKYREKNGVEHVDFMYDIFLDAVKKWQSEGTMRKDIDSRMIMALFGAIINVDTHKEEIGMEYFPEIMKYLTEFVMKGLTDFTGQA